MPSPAPPLAGVLETALYVDDMALARHFYEDALGLVPMFADARLTAYPVGPRSALLLFLRGATAEVVHLPAPHLQTPEAYPMAVQSDGVAETAVTPSAPSRQALARWAERQSPTPQGSVRPVIVVLEPLAAMAQPDDNQLGRR